MTTAACYVVNDSPPQTRFRNSKERQIQATSLLSAPILCLLDGESRWDWAKRPLTRRYELRALPQACWTEPSGASWAAMSGAP